VDYLYKPLVPEMIRAKVATFVQLAKKTQALEGEIAQRHLAEEALRQVQAELNERLNKRSEALRESEERFRLLVDGMKDYAIFMLDPRGNITSWNLGAALMYGFGAGEVLGAHVSRFYAQEDVERGLPDGELRSALCDGRCAAEGWRIRKDGTRFWASAVVTALCDSDGNLRGFGKVVRDMTEQKAAEAALRESQALFRDFMSHSPALAFVRDGNGRIVYVNAAYERFFGASLSELKGRMLNEVVPEGTAVALRALYQRVLDEDRSLQEDYPVPAPDGTPHDLRFYVFPITNAAGERFLGGFALDISDQSRLEEQLRQSQKMEAVGRLAGGVAHDFNNMLAVILGYSELALNRIPAEDPLCRFVTEINKAGERATDLTRQLLAFSRRQIIEARLLDLNEVVLGIEPMLRRLIGEDIDLATVPLSVPAQVMADPGQIEQVILNLAVNARDAMPKGGKVTVEVQRARLDERYAREHAEVTPGDYLLLAVSDNGEGMDAETQARIFEPFFTTKEQGKGTGLGLSTVFGIVKQNSGHISVYSEPGHGTTFKVYLPRAGSL
jgi:two-component system, cell cycle sensor histidine kinase and response regulator CckA